MKRSTIRVIVFLATFLLAGLMIIQIYWVNKAWQAQEKQFHYEVSGALREVYQDIFKHSNDSTPLIEPVKKISENYYVVSTNDTLHPIYLESLLATSFKKYAISADYEYGIYDCFTDSIVYSKRVQKEISTSPMPEASELKWTRDGHYFSVFFPSANVHIFKEMGFWALSTALILAVIIFFAYVILLVLKQKRLSEIKNDFINNMTHELKTPISTISLSADVINRDDILQNPERLKKYAVIIKNENHRLQQQVEKVLSAATIEQDKLKLKKEAFDLHHIISSNVKAMEIILEEKNGTIALKMDAENSVIIGDEVHLKHVVNNLLDNAVKYCLENPVIEISTQNIGNGIQLKISDNGIGIPKKHLPFVFDKFYRVPTGNVHNVKGFGIGLNYVKVIIEAHNGKISINSEENQGTEITIKLPFKSGNNEK